MTTGLYVAYAGAAAAQADVEIIANNVANAGTTGFRRDQTLFDSVLAENMAFSRATAGQIDLSPGTHQQNENPLNVAIDGEGFFVAQDGDGNSFYTRRGDFQLNANQQLTLPNGMVVLGKGGPITIPSGATASFRNDGTLMTENGPIGQLRVVRFNDPSLLSKVGGSVIRAESGAAPEDVEQTRVAVGFIESSNVNLAAEMVALIQATRTFEAALQSMRTDDRMTQQLIQAQS